MSEFMFGDRVIVKVGCAYHRRVGKIGTVINRPETDFNLCIEFDQPFLDGHDGCGRGKDGYCYFLSPSDVELYFPIQEELLPTKINFKFDELME